MRCRYLHAQRKIHRDMKASNLLLNPQGVVKLCDFGALPRMSRASDLHLGITTTIENGKKRETQVGSPFWMAPEIISGEGYDQQVRPLSARDQAADGPIIVGGRVVGRHHCI